MSSMIKTYPAKDNYFGYVVLFLTRFEPMSSEELDLECVVSNAHPTLVNINSPIMNCFCLGIKLMYKLEALILGL